MRRISLLLFALLLSGSVSAFIPAHAVDSPPLLYGYGGILATGSVHITTGSPSSEVFSGETASNTEVTFARMKAKGYNGARVSIIDPGNQADSGTYNSNAWHRTLQLAEHYGITVIGDDHEYTIASSWLPFWRTVIQDTPQSEYPNVLWEAQNEPHDSNLAADFQALIDMDRGLGDTRWIVLGCNNDCSPTGGGTDLALFPVVTDPVNHVFYDFHEYFFYPPHSGEWTNSAAEAFADSKYRGALDVQSSLGRPFIGTEFGADTGCGDPVYGCPPDQVVYGSAGYAPETVAYLSRLITDLQGAGLGYMIWNAGDWDEAPAGISGAMDTFGSQLPPPPSTTTQPPTQPPILPPILPGGLGGGWATLALLVAVAILIGALVVRKMRRRPVTSATLQ